MVSEILNVLLLEPEIRDFLNQVFPKYYVFIPIFLSGYLLYFGMARILKYKSLQELRSWEVLIWSLLFATLNSYISLFVGILPIVIVEKMVSVIYNIGISGDGVIILVFFIASLSFPVLAIFNHKNFMKIKYSFLFFYVTGFLSLILVQLFLFSKWALFFIILLLTAGLSRYIKRKVMKKDFFD
jgi:hypothetical protein